MHSTTCETCHATTGWKPATFDHGKQSAFALEGKHKEAHCEACHVVVDTGSAKVAKYKPLASTCASCHDDEHKGSFDAFTPATTTVRGCAACHAPAGWSPPPAGSSTTSLFPSSAM